MWTCRIKGCKQTGNRVQDINHTTHFCFEQNWTVQSILCRQPVQTWNDCRPSHRRECNLFLTKMDWFLCWGNSPALHRWHQIPGADHQAWMCEWFVFHFRLVSLGRDGGRRLPHKKSWSFWSRHQWALHKTKDFLLFYLSTCHYVLSVFITALCVAAPSLSASFCVGVSLIRICSLVLRLLWLFELAHVPIFSMVSVCYQVRNIAHWFSCFSVCYRFSDSLCLLSALKP